MICYWVTEKGSAGVAAYRESRGRAIATRFQTLVYDDIRRAVRFPAGAQIFSALDQLTDTQRDVVAAIWDAHARVVPNTPRLNDPRRVLLRFQLLKALHEHGLNAYRVFRATDLRSVDRFPVFIRHMHDHSGPKSRLLRTRNDVAASLRRLQLRGHRLRNLMIVEFCDTLDGDGLYRKYAAFKVGNRIIPCHVLASHEWCVKSVLNEPTEDTIGEGVKYLEKNPHAEWLGRVFAIAAIDYGRVDYGVQNGVPQAWEINLNPTIGRGSGWRRGSALPIHLRQLREGSREVFHGQLKDAFVALDTAVGDVPEVNVEFNDALVAVLLAEQQARHRRARISRALSRLIEHPQIGFPARAVLKLFPRPEPEFENKRRERKRS